MPFLIPFIPAIAAGIGAVGAAVGAKSKTFTSSTSPTLSPELQSAQSGQLSTLRGITSDPSAGLGPIKQAAQDSINRGYAKLPQLASTKLAARGFGASGKVGDAVYDTEGARLGDLSQLHGKIAELASSRQLTASQILEQMINSGRGSTTTGTSPGQGLAAGLQSGASSLANWSALHTLSEMFKNGGNFGGVPGPGVSVHDLLGSGATPGGSTTGNLGTIGPDMSGAFGGSTPNGSGWGH